MTFAGHIPRKRFGQHWLRDDVVLEKIIEAAEIQSSDRLLEIGPGRGVLTEKLLKSSAELVHGIELDLDLVAGLRKRFSADPRFTLLEGDALSVSLTLPDGRSANKVVANIPYNITSPLLDRLVGRLGQPVEDNYQRLVLLLQKEVAMRILSLPGQSDFSAISVKLQLLARCRSVCEVPPSSFNPRPKVYSQVIILDPLNKKERLSLELEKKVAALLRMAFLSRRKKLKNTLKGIGPLAELEVLAKGQGISLDQRPQELSPMNWVELAKGLQNRNKVRK
ncbi:MULTISPECIES: 16S rRNA (adenine(1518)-N(6)/adenine(1519)-N(6))-dimethyltransferase RsmA [unclassified Prochlorococcus]|uniref:16S rRNA (adenine(1518)-N(6)/adenine(1519)-N(6))- dimethyltransferase RsmA n=1 Tax=unclassified Prochlorococcus TaxID=2627481 RepID=UPI000533B745|nr:MULTISPECIES: 16S rRNA (adenine(1518)-N(6)/adenine(1519)-N(6))-dimethyltransferase RsmA [unclassified Prochlorococcus]KGG15077.1 Dimethyladenosine transferase [Prochlorococcus sp. MIT 0602]KGG17349.1 Dimethyladenosine transferase [Prochlorococcus sp. MIT 0603]